MEKSGKELGERVRNARLRAGLKQVDVSVWFYRMRGESKQQSQSSYSRWERGEGGGVNRLAQNVEAIWRLAEACGEEPMYLLRGERCCGVTNRSAKDLAVWFARCCRVAPDAIERVAAIDIGIEMSTLEWFQAIVSAHQKLLEEKMWGDSTAAEAG